MNTVVTSKEAIMAVCRQLVAEKGLMGYCSDINLN